jgi:hypothetical protein
MKIDRLIGILSILLQEEKTTAPELEPWGQRTCYIADSEG